MVVTVPATSVTAQRGQFAVGAVVGVLLEDALDIVLHEETDVWPTDPLVGKRQQVMTEVGHVIPHPKPRRHLRPRLDIGAERLIRPVVASLQEMGETALNRTEPDDDVGTRTHGLGRLSGPLVGQRFDNLVGKLLLHGLRHGIDQMQDRRHLRVFPLGQFLAVRALAMVVPIVLRNRKHRGLRLGLHGFPDSFGADANHVQVGAA